MNQMCHLPVTLSNDVCARSISLGKDMGTSWVQYKLWNVDSTGNVEIAV